MILIDEYGHLVSDDSQKELLDFAAALDVGKEQMCCKLYSPHFHLATPELRQRAEKAGAVRVEVSALINQAWWAKQYPALSGKAVLAA
jgi:hypothetical protein